MTIVYQPHQYSQQRQKEKKAWVYPVLLAMEAQHYRERGHDVKWDCVAGIHDAVITEPQGLHFKHLPAPDRVFTNALDKKYQQYGNYKYHPATHILSASGCSWGNCKFCVENGQKYYVREVDSVIKEIDTCIKLGFKEIFDDSATLPTGKWLNDFCFAMIPRDITLGCNLRIDSDVDFRLMKDAGFRMILFGVESFNQDTLNRINKGILVKNIIPTLKAANDAGIQAHAACMVGYPWETLEQELNTINTVKKLLIDGVIKTAQVSVYDIGEEKIDRGTKDKIYECARYPKFWINTMKDIRDWHDIIYLLKKIRKGIYRD